MWGLYFLEHLLFLPCNNVRSIVYRAFIARGLITLQTTPPLPIPPTVVDWLGRLRNTFMHGARGHSHNRWGTVLTD